MDILTTFPNVTYTDTRSFLEKKFHRYPGVLNYLSSNNSLTSKHQKKKNQDTIDIILDKNKMENLPVIKEKDSLPEKRLKVHRILEYLGIKNKYANALLKLADIYFVNFHFFYKIYIYIYI